MRELTETMTIRPITERDDKKIAAIVRMNLKQYHLDIPGTAYYDPELEHLSWYYADKPAKRAYYILEDEKGRILGGVGFAEFEAIPDCAEIQKLYLVNETKGKGLGRKLLETAEEGAREKGYQRLYLETHSALVEAISLYEKMGYETMAKPDFVFHTTMDRFYWKQL